MAPRNSGGTVDPKARGANHVLEKKMVDTHCVRGEHTKL